VALPTDVEDVVAVGHQLADEDVGFVDVGAGGVNAVEPFFASLCLHLRRYPVCGEHYRATIDRVEEVHSARRVL
jgi:hypothetical protein